MAVTSYISSKRGTHRSRLPASRILTIPSSGLQGIGSAGGSRVGKRIPATAAGASAPSRQQGSLEQKQSARSNTVPCLESAHIHTTRQIRTIEPDLVDSRIHAPIHYHGNLSAKDVEQTQPHHG